MFSYQKITSFTRDDGPSSATKARTDSDRIR